MIFIILLSLTFIIKVNAVSLDIERMGSIHGIYQYDDVTLSNVGVQIYKIASLNKNGTLDFLPAFNSFDTNIYNMKKSELNEYAENLYHYILENGYEVQNEARTDNNGEYDFDNLSLGLYLIYIDDIEIDKKIYTSIPMIISVPYYNELDDEYIYTITSENKIEVIEVKEEVQNNNVDSPKTYDNVIWYITLFIISLFIIVILIYYIKREKRKK